VLFICTFGFSVYFINMGVQVYAAQETAETGQESELFVYESHSGWTVWNALFNQYIMLVGGNYETDQYDETAYGNALWFFWALSCFISQVVILNMLVNILGDTQAEFEEKKEQSTLKEKIQNLCDYEDVIETEVRDWTHLV
jgi:hypothetical protein